ncbi:PREDICTED: protein NDR1-like [Tarenaya hassleriana]|uniref:protein NDR1-like n=1 Tax=Tarenaya hassleriana TaxID=28532 RepID=UPI00053C4A1F|nr:PREDICTED: protein NDR1-like [Tarenaya hassleriana]
MAEPRSCCSACTTIVLSLGLTSLFLWLSLRPDKPKCSIQYFYVPSLNKTLDSSQNTSLNFMVRLDNPKKDQGIYYDDVRLSFFNSSSRTHFLGNYTIPRFYQGHKKKAKKWGKIQPLDKEAVLRAVLPNGSAVFRVDLDTEVRYKIVFWKTKRHKIQVGADVEVNDQGEKAKKKKGVKMRKSSSSRGSCLCVSVVVLIDLLLFLMISP